MRLLTTEEYKQKIIDNQIDVEVISKYTGTHKPITVKCLKCGKEWTSSACHILDKSSPCPDCQIVKIRHKFALSDEEFLQRVKDANPYIIPLDKYTNKNTIMKFKCIKHNYVFENKPSNFSDHKGLGCILCALDEKRGGVVFTTDAIRYLVNSLGCEYVDSVRENKKCYVSFICPEHREKGVQTKDLYKFRQAKQPCDYCNGNKRDKEDFIKLVNEINPSIEVVGEYYGAREYVEIKCKECGYIWNSLAYNVLSGYGCPLCKLSKAEKEINKILTENKIDFVPQKTFDDLKDIDLLSFDFYIPSINTAIEYDGEQHFTPTDFDGSGDQEEVERNFIKYKMHDLMKDDYCKKNNIRLIRIPYWEKQNLENVLRCNKIIT